MNKNKLNMDLDKLNEALEIVHWSLFSDKQGDKKPSDMTIEEAEHIIFQHQQKVIID